MRNYFITAGKKRRIPTEIAHIAIPDGWQVIARTNVRKPSYPQEQKRDHIYMFRFGYPFVSITNRCW